VKCNNQRPICGACSDANSSCVYDDAEDHSVFDPASLKILERLDQVLSRLDQMPSTSTAVPSSVGLTYVIQEDNSRSTATFAKNVASHGQNGTDADPWMPAARTNVEAVLTWPVFAMDNGSSPMLRAIYGAEIEEDDQNTNKRSAGIVEGDIPRLVQRFVEFVHLKNPVIDVETLWSYTHHVVEDGIDWSPPSCLVVSSRAFLQKLSAS
jgi:hypothetical protein